MNILSTSESTQGWNNEKCSSKIITIFCQNKYTQVQINFHSISLVLKLFHFLQQMGIYVFVKKNAADKQKGLPCLPLKEGFC